VHAVNISPDVAACLREQPSMRDNEVGTLFLLLISYTNLLLHFFLPYYRPIQCFETWSQKLRFGCL